LPDNNGVKFGIQLPHDPADLILKASIFADRNGFHSVFTPDHLVGIGIRNWYAFESFTLLGAISQVTHRVKLGICVSDVLRRHPAVLAQFAITLDNFSMGRAILGLGAGEGMNLIPYGISTKSLVSKLEEGTEVIKKLLTQDHVDFEGRFFHLKNAFVGPKSRQKSVPLWIAGNSQRTMELTARFGDGWVPTAGMGPERYREGLEYIRKRAKEYGRTEKIEPAIFAYIVVERDYDEAVKKIELPAKILSLMSPARKTFLKKAGIDPDSIEIPDLINFTFNRDNMKTAIEYAKSIPFEAVKDRYIFGTPDDVIGKIESFVEAGVEHFVLTPLVRRSEYMKTIKTIAYDVITYFS
jgi:phthiodiolone/phenolphthiodiolone dimycocerosates ketoreductase